MDNEGKKKIVTRIPADESKTSRVAYGKKIKVAMSIAEEIGLKNVTFQHLYA